MDEEVDIYGDIPQFHLDKELDRVQKESEVLGKKVTALSLQIQALTNEKIQLEKKLLILQKNISILLKTAKQELVRKDKMIADLRQELEAFRTKRSNNLLNRQPENNADKSIETSTKKGSSIKANEAKIIKKSNDEPKQSRHVANTKSHSTRGSNSPIPEDRLVPNDDNRSHRFRQREGSGSDYRNRRNEERKRSRSRGRYYEDRRNDRLSCHSRDRKSFDGRNIRKPSSYGHRSRSRSPYDIKRSRSPHKDIGHQTREDPVSERNRHVTTSKDFNRVASGTLHSSGIKIENSPPSYHATSEDIVKNPVEELESAAIESSSKKGEMEEGEVSESADDESANPVVSDDINWQTSFRRPRKRRSPPKTLFSMRMARRIQEKENEEKLMQETLEPNTNDREKVLRIDEKIDKTEEIKTVPEAAIACQKTSKDVEDETPVDEAKLHPKSEALNARTTSMSEDATLTVPVEFSPFKNNYKLIELSLVPLSEKWHNPAPHKISNEQRTNEVSNSSATFEMKKPGKPLSVSDIIDNKKTESPIYPSEVVEVILETDKSYPLELESRTCPEKPKPEKELPGFDIKKYRIPLKKKNDNKLKSVVIKPSLAMAASADETTHSTALTTSDKFRNPSNFSERDKEPISKKHLETNIKQRRKEEGIDPMKSRERLQGGSKTSQSSSTLESQDTNTKKDRHKVNDLEDLRSRKSRSLSKEKTGKSATTKIEKTSVNQNDKVHDRKKDNRTPKEPSTDLENTEEIKVEIVNDTSRKKGNGSESSLKEKEVKNSEAKEESCIRNSKAESSSSSRDHDGVSRSKKESNKKPEKENSDGEHMDRAAGSNETVTEKINRPGTDERPTQKAEPQQHEKICSDINESEKVELKKISEAKASSHSHHLSPIDIEAAHKLALMESSHDLTASSSFTPFKRKMDEIIERVDLKRHKDATDISKFEIFKSANLSQSSSSSSGADVSQATTDTVNTRLQSDLHLSDSEESEATSEESSAEGSDSDASDLMDLIC